MIDLDTGEYLGDSPPVLTPPKRRNGFGQRWFAMAQDVLEALAQEDLGDEARRVLFGLLAHLSHENHVLTPQSEIASRIGMARTHFSRGLSRLVKKGVVEKGPKIGRMVSLRLNPEYGWKGTAKNHVVELDKHRNERMKAAGISAVLDGGRDERTVDTHPESHK